MSGENLPDLNFSQNFIKQPGMLNTYACQWIVMQHPVLIDDRGKATTNPNAALMRNMIESMKKQIMDDIDRDIMDMLEMQDKVGYMFPDGTFNSDK